VTWPVTAEETSQKPTISRSGGGKGWPTLFMCKRQRNCYRSMGTKRRKQKRRGNMCAKQKGVLPPIRREARAYQRVV